MVDWRSVGGCVDLGPVHSVLFCCVLRRAVLSFGSVYWGCWMSLVLFMRSLFTDFVFFVWLWFCLSLIVWRRGVFIEILWKFWVLVVFARVLFTLVVSHYDCLWFKVFHCLRLLEDFAHLLSVRELVSTPVFVHYYCLWVKFFTVSGYWRILHICCPYENFKRVVSFLPVSFVSRLIGASICVLEVDWFH